MTKRISVEDSLPDYGELVSVYSQEGDKYGYAKLGSKKRYNETVNKWVIEEAQSIRYSPISHWWPVPELPEEE